MKAALTTPKVIGFVPARAGSKRVPGKNVRCLQGHPLLAYSLASALASGIFSRVIVSTDSEEIARLSRHYGAEVPFLRPSEYAGEKSPDIEWVIYTLQRLRQSGEIPDAFAILRPTSPFRMPETIQRAWERFSSTDADSLRAVEPCRQHPGKMWIVEGDLMSPLLDDGGVQPPWHSTPYQALPLVHAQNASLEMAWSRVPLELGTIAGKKIVPFFTQGNEGFDINNAEDWLLAEILLEKKGALLPRVCQPAWQADT
jgi:N-acylneuraminate cytidylyltransferase